MYICEACGTDISIHARREEGDGPAGGTAYHHRISIHALREEGDKKDNLPTRQEKISIHALREEGDSCSFQVWR